MTVETTLQKRRLRELMTFIVAGPLISMLLLGLAAYRTAADLLFGFMIIFSRLLPFGGLEPGGNGRSIRPSARFGPATRASVAGGRGNPAGYSYRPLGGEYSDVACRLLGAVQCAATAFVIWRSESVTA